MLDSFVVFVFACLRSLLKWFFRKTTKLCELQRICYGEPAGGPRSLALEVSLRKSNCLDIKELVIYLDKKSDEIKFNTLTERHIVEYAIHCVVRVKNINVNIHQQFVRSFGVCVAQIWGFRQLINELDVLRATGYNSSNPEHESKLTKLWDLLMPGTPLKSRISKQWSEIGFQGEDPATDFRGMGMLGLENLLYFAEQYPAVAQHVLGHSHHPIWGYSFAVVGINITHTAFCLMTDLTAKAHIYNSVTTRPTMSKFHHLYSYLFFEFDRFWLSEKPRDLMEFGRVHKKFETNIREILSDPLHKLILNVYIDTV